MDLCKIPKLERNKISAKENCKVFHYWTFPGFSRDQQDSKLQNEIVLNSKLNFLYFVPFAGRPIPKVTWWRDNVEMVTSVSHPSADGATAVVNQLFIGTVTRDFYGSRLECRAQGSKLLPPVAKEITVQVHCELSSTRHAGLLRDSIRKLFNFISFLSLPSETN